jgi:hypothetical protein
MLYEIRADRDVTSKGPQGSGTRRRTVKLPEGEVTLTIGAQPIYLNADVLPPAIAGDEHLLTKTVTAESFDPGTTVIDLKAERVQEESVAAPPDADDLKAERVQGPESVAVAPPDDDDKLKAERVQNPTAVAATNKPKRR